MTRRLLLCLISGVAMMGGCSGEMEPFRAKDPEKARAAILKKKLDPGRPPGLPLKSKSPRKSGSRLATFPSV